MDRPHLRRRGAVALAVALLATAASLALAAPAGADSRPAVTSAEPVVTGTAVTLAFTVNRAEHAIASADCALTGADGVAEAVSCGTPGPGPVRRSTGYTATLADVAPGDHAYAVTITLTDGGTATAVVPFTVEEPAPVEFAASVGACGALSGSAFVAHAYWWQLWACDFDAASQGAADAASAVLGPLCLADGGYALVGGFVSPGRYELSCFTF